MAESKADKVDVKDVKDVKKVEKVEEVEKVEPVEKVKEVKDVKKVEKVKDVEKVKEVKDVEKVEPAKPAVGKSAVAKSKIPAGRYHYALGRRKTSTARVRLLNGSGAIKINGQSADDYLAQSQPLLAELHQPFVAVGVTDKFDVSAKVRGGGHHGQVGAVKLGIARTLVITDPDYKDTLKRHDLLGRDPRAKERKKFGLKGARKQRQFTKR